MTQLTTGRFRTIDRSDAIADDEVVPYYLDDRTLRISITRVDGACTRSTTSARAPTSRARSPGVCLPGRRSCVSATAPGST